MGGNSTKATSGINGAGTQTQQMNGIPDNAKIFFDDTKKSVRKSSLILQLAKLTFDYRRVISLVMI
jgi:succinate dehydrogenase/fumarate reductase flavoprotein subunit